MDGVEEKALAESLHPMFIRPVNHELSREGLSHDRWPHWGQHRNQQLAFPAHGIAQQHRVRNASDEIRHRSEVVGYIEVCVV